MKILRTSLISAALMSLGGIVTLGILHFTDVKSVQPYSGQDDRDIASLSAKDIDDLLAGRGWGFAKPAELNQYPGPLHLLELVDEIELSEMQVTQITAVFNSMQAEAKALGKEFVEAEAALSKSFGDQKVDEAMLRQQITAAERLRGALRESHLSAHLAVRPLLNDDQIAAYQIARGYADGHQHSGH